MEKTMKKILCTLMVVLMCLTSAPLDGLVGLDLPQISFGTTKASALSSSGSCGSNVTYTYDSDTKALTISGTGKMWDYYSSYGRSPFYDSDIKSVVIESGVTSIGEYAFYNCTSLTSITIPDSVTSIGSSAFRGCTGLTSVTIPDSVTSIGWSVFSGCTSLTSVIIPDSVTSIGSYAFSGCTSLTSVTIPDSVTSIGSSAFDGCSKLSAVYISDIAAWCNISFSGAASNPLYYAEKLYLNGDLVTDLVIPDSVTSIGNAAFSGCTSLTSITIGNSVTSIGSEAFYGCNKLSAVYISDIAAWCNISFSYSSYSSYPYSSNPLYYAKSLYLKNKLVMRLTIPDTVTEIKNYAFYNCNTLLSVTIPDSVTSIGSSAFSGCTNLGSVTIPDSVTSIGSSAFSGCTNLGSVTIPDNVTSIGDWAFDDCISLTSITIPDSVTSIGNGAFDDCISLTSVIIPDSVTSIDWYAFYGCTSLTSVTIPDSVTSIGRYAFSGCNKLSAVYISDIAAWCNISFSYDSDSSYLCPSNPLYYAKKLYLNGELVTDLVIPDGVTNIKEYVFYNCKSITSVTFPDGTTSINSNRFNNCSNITSVTIPESVTRIDTGALSDVNKDMTVYGYADSYAEFFATTNGYKFIAICTHETSSYTYSNEIAATCTADGYTAGTYCNECERWIEGHEVIKAQHSYTSSVTKVPSHTEEGETTYTCACGDSYTEAIAKTTEHSYTSTTVPATCTTDGKITYTCACGDTYTETISAHHTDENQDDICDSCGANLKDTTGEHEHSYTSTTVPATCTADGKTTYTCACGDSYTETISATGHAYPDAWSTIIVPSCTDKGVKIKVCTNCYDVLAETIDKTSHADQNKDNICDNCGAKLKDTTHVHTYGDWSVTKEPTHTEEGLKVKTCSSCGDVITEPIEKTKEHTYTSTTIPATCTTDGQITYTCACGDSYTETIYAHHTDENGDDICDVCRTPIEPSIKLGETKTIDISAGKTIYLAFCPKKSGTYKFTSNSTYDSFGYLLDADLKKIISNDDGPDGKNFEIICDLEAGVKYYFGARFYATSRAGSMDVTLSCVHKWDEGKVTTKATHAQEGVKTFTCATCDNTYTEPIAKTTEHTYILSETVAPTCAVAGSKIFTCACGDSYSEAIPAISHIDSNSDSYCDSCGADLNPQAHCSCNCHKTGITKFFFTIINFFEKLFGQNKVCACGAIH